jgi:molybdopterin-guanine dinucleotide biosynthesis protein A
VASGFDSAAGIVLAGGRSSRMGAPKAGLEWHGSTLLYRTTALLARAASGPVVVVKAPGQHLPDLPSGVEVVADPVEGLGPLQGIAAGLTAVASRAPVAFVCSTDLPFLHPAFVRRVLRAFDEPGTDVVLPVARGYRQPLAAAYRTALADLIGTLVAAGNLRPGILLEQCHVRPLDDAELLTDPELARFDPDLDSLLNVNAPEDYVAARQRPAAKITVEHFGQGPHPVRAATLGAAASAVGLELDGHVEAAVNGGQPTRDARIPLVAGDSVAFRGTA